MSNYYPKPGISAMRAWSLVTDAWGPFAAWLGGANSFSWQIAPDLAAGGAVDSESLVGSNLVASIEANTAASPGAFPNALRCQCEQFNALASLVAAQPAGRANFAITGGGAAFAGYMPDGANYFPVYNLGASALTVSPYNVSPGTTILPVWPRTAFYAWQTPAGSDPVATYMSGLGATVRVTPVFGTGSGSLSWISIDDARTIYAVFGIPFTLDVVAYPVSWVADNTMTYGGYFTPDANGAYLAASSYGSGPMALANSTSPAGNPSMSLNGVLLVKSHITSGLVAIVPPILCVQREGMYDLCVSAIPQNYAYQADPASLDQAALQALGSQIIPIYADNTVESANSEATVVPGAGGAGQYDHVITTGLSNTVVMTTPVEAVIYPPVPGGI